MTSKKAFFVMIGALGLLGVAVVTSVVLGDMSLHKQSMRLASLRLDNQVIDAQQAALVQANKDIKKYAELQSIAKQVVPQDKDQARATREIVSLASQAGIKIASITFPASTLGQAPPPPSAGTPAPAAPTTPSVSQVKAVDGIKGLYQFDITVVSDTTHPSTYKQVVGFLDKLEQNRRTSQVSQISITPDSQNRAGLNFSLTITVYIKP